MVDAGGFDTVKLASQDFIAFSGNVTLKAGQSISLVSTDMISAPLTTQAPSASAIPATGDVVIDAPYVLLSSPNTIKIDNGVGAFISTPILSHPFPTDATFTVDADLIDVQGAVAFSTRITTNQVNASTMLYGPGFADVRLDSQGDIRFLAPTGHLPGTGLETAGDLDLIGAQVYPASNATATIAAVDGFDGPSTLTIGRNDDSLVPAMPLSLFGVIDFTATNIVQDGIVRAPMGNIGLGFGATGNFSSATSAEVTLMPGSITSVSSAGLTMPYGARRTA